MEHFLCKLPELAIYHESAPFHGVYRNTSSKTPFTPELRMLGLNHVVGCLVMWWVMTIEIPQSGLIVHIMCSRVALSYVEEVVQPKTNCAVFCYYPCKVISYDHRKYICHGHQKSFADTRLAPKSCSIQVFYTEIHIMVNT